VLQGLPRALQKYPVLRIEDLRLARRDSEEAGIEQFGTFQDGALANQPLIVSYASGNPGRIELGIAERLKRFAARAYVAPEIIKVSRIREPSRQADDGDRLRRVRLERLLGQTGLNHEIAFRLGSGYAPKRRRTGRSTTAVPLGWRPSSAGTVQ
jgi:hypothetical protein